MVRVECEVEIKYKKKVEFIFFFFNEDESIVKFECQNKLDVVMRTNWNNTTWRSSVRLRLTWSMRSS